MALYVRQNDQRSKLQENLAAELREKSKRRAALDSKATLDGVEDSKYIEGTKKTTSLAWIWVLVIIGAISALIWLMREAGAA